MEDLNYLTDIENKLRRMKSGVRERTDNYDELVQLLDDLPYDRLEPFETSISVLLYRLLRHIEVWHQVRAEVQYRKNHRPSLKRIK